MEPTNITMLNQLDVLNNVCVLKVRILKLWRLKDNSKPGEDWSIETILQDENCIVTHSLILLYYSYNFVLMLIIMYRSDIIQAYVRKACIPKHAMWLGENRSLIVILMFHLRTQI